MSVWDTAGEDYLKQCGKVPRENLCEVLKPKSLSGAAEYLKKNYDLPLSVNEIVDGVNKRWATSISAKHSRRTAYENF